MNGLAPLARRSLSPPHEPTGQVEPRGVACRRRPATTRPTQPVHIGRTSRTGRSSSTKVRQK